MPLRVVCPGCKTPLTIPDERRGTQVQCPSCGTRMQVGTKQPAPAPPPPPALPSSASAPTDFSGEKAAPDQGVQAGLSPRGARPAAAPQLPSWVASTNAADAADVAGPGVRSAGGRLLSAPSRLALGALGALVLFGVGVGLAFLLHDEPPTRPDSPAHHQSADVKPADTKPEDNQLAHAGPGDSKPEANNPKDSKDATPADPPRPVDPPRPPDPPPGPVVSIQPAPLKADTEERPLPSAVSDTCVGGGGRFFILLLAKQRQLAVFDVNEAKVVKFLPVPEDHIRFAASMDKLFVVCCDAGIIQRFSLETFEREVAVPLPVQGTVKTIATGSAAAGPLLIHYARTGDAPDDAPVAFLDPVRFKELDIVAKGDTVRLSGRDAYHYRASPDGTVFGGWITSRTQSMSSIVLTGKTANVHRGEMAGLVVPGADNTLVTGGGLFTAECKARGGDKADPRFRLRIPSQTGRFYLSCPGGGGAQVNTGNHDGKPVDAYLMGDARPFATLPTVELPTANEAWINHDFTQDKRVLFVPEGKLIAVIPKSNDRLVLHRFDVDAALDKADVAYLFVTSRPPSTAYKGTQLRYPLQVKSKKGGVKLKLESGPDGMKVNADGKLTWDVPKDFADTTAEVIVSVSDASGQEVFHSFRLLVKDKAEVVP